MRSRYNPLERKPVPTIAKCPGGNAASRAWDRYLAIDGAASPPVTPPTKKRELDGPPGAPRKSIANAVRDGPVRALEF